MLAARSSPKLPLPASVYPDTHTFPPVTPLTHSHVCNSTHRTDIHTQTYTHSDAATPAFSLTNTLTPLPTHWCTQTHINAGEAGWKDSHACLLEKGVGEKPPSPGRANLLTHSAQRPQRAPWFLGTCPRPGGQLAVHSSDSLAFQQCSSTQHVLKCDHLAISLGTWIWASQYRYVCYPFMLMEQG